MAIALLLGRVRDARGVEVKPTKRHKKDRMLFVDRLFFLCLFVEFRPFLRIYRGVVVFLRNSRVNSREVEL